MPSNKEQLVQPSLQWYQGLDAEDKEALSSALNASRESLVYKRLKYLVERELKVLNNLSFTNYDKASWAYMQADLNGCKRALLTIKQLLNFMEDRTDA